MRCSGSLLAVVLFCLCTLVMALPSYSQEIIEPFKKPIPEFELSSVEGFENVSKVYLEEAAKESALNFKVRIPQKWVESSHGLLGNISISNTVLGELQTFYSPADFEERSRLKIEATKREYQMTVEQWLIQYLLANGYNLQGMQVHDDRNAEALYVLIDGGITYAVRSVARANGKYVLFAQYFVPLDRWHDEKDQMLHILNSFEPLEEVGGFVEEMDRYQFLDWAEVLYPSSWMIKAAPIRSIDRMKIKLLNVEVIEKPSQRRRETRLDGQIDVSLISIFESESLEEELEVVRAEFADQGIVMGDVLESRDDFLFGDRFDFVDTQVYHATKNGNEGVDYELWLTIMAAGEYYYFVTLFTESRDDDYFLWARNSETYKLVTSQVNPSERSNYDE